MARASESLGLEGGSELTKYAAFAYDGTIALGAALHRASLYTTPDNGTAVYSELMGVGFTGASGLVALDAATGDRSESSLLFGLDNWIETTIPGSGARGSSRGFEVRRVGAFQGGVLSGTLASITWIGGGTTRPTDGSLAVALCTSSDIVPSVGACSGGVRALTFAPNVSVLCEVPPLLTLPTDSSLPCGYATLTDPEGLIPTILAVVLLLLVALAFLRDWAFARDAPLTAKRMSRRLDSVLRASSLLGATLLILCPLYLSNEPSDALCAVRPTLLKFGHLILHGTITLRCFLLYVVPIPPPPSPLRATRTDIAGSAEPTRPLPTQPSSASDAPTAVGAASDPVVSLATGLATGGAFNRALLASRSSRALHAHYQVTREHAKQGALLVALSLLIANVIHTLVWMITSPPTSVALTLKFADAFPSGFFPSDATYTQPACDAGDPAVIFFEIFFTLILVLIGLSLYVRLRCVDSASLGLMPLLVSILALTLSSALSWVGLYPHPTTSSPAAFRPSTVVVSILSCVVSLLAALALFLCDSYQ